MQRTNPFFSCLGACFRTVEKTKKPVVEQHTETFEEKETLHLALDLWAKSVYGKEATLRAVAIQRIEYAYDNELRFLDLSGLQLTNLPPVMDKLSAVKILILDNNPLRILSEPLPPHLQTLDLNHTLIEQLSDDQVSTLHHLSLRKAPIDSLPWLPDELESLDISETRVEYLPLALPSHLRLLNISKTPIKSLPSLPGGLRHLWATECKVAPPKMSSYPRDIDILR